MAYVNYSSMYMQNHLHTFSFGAPSSDSSSVHPIDPLSRPRDDSETDFVPIPDTTPRPSVVSTSHSPSCYQSQRPSQIKSSKGVGQIPHERDSDTASSHTFGTCSISSSSRPSGSRTNSSRSNTSDNDATSDEELGGRHPLPAEFSSPDISPVYRHTDQDVSSMYALEEEYDYNDDYDHDPEAGIEIDSVAHPGSDRCTIDYRNVSRESVPFDYAQKRGSEALPITTSSDRSYLENRIRENSVATLRRPSRSMDELRSFNFAQEVASSSLAPHTERSLPPSPTSVPGSEGDWRDLRKKSIQRDKDLPSISRIMANQHSSELHDFDPFWMHHRVNGVVGFDLSELNDIVGEDRTGCRSSNDLLRKDSEFGAYRRPSTASSGNVDIMYRRIIGPWATQKDRDQRRMWTFVKEHDRLPPEDIHTRQNIERERSSISSFFGSGSRPSSSATLEHGGILFFDGQNKEKAAGKEKAPKEIWRGMPLDSEEFWNNQATGRFRVYRRNTPC
jgi:hypothetical protein